MHNYTHTCTFPNGKPFHIIHTQTVFYILYILWVSPTPEANFQLGADGSSFNCKPRGLEVSR